MRELQNKKRDFKGIWIPADIWLNTDLTLLEKIVFLEIDSLDGEDGCYANNQHFADFCNVSKGRASQIINNLKEKGYISVEISRDSRGQVTKRTIRSLMKYQRVALSSKAIEGVPSKAIEGCIENDEYKNTSFKNTSSKDKEYSPTKVEQDISDVKDIFNIWIESNIIKHKTLTDKMKTKIKTRLKEYDKEDIMTSIKNYGIILNDDRYYFTYKWTLIKFLDRGLDEFMDFQAVHNNYMKAEYRKTGGIDHAKPNTRVGEDKKDFIAAAQEKYGKINNTGNINF